MMESVGGGNEIYTAPLLEENRICIKAFQLMKIYPAKKSPQKNNHTVECCNTVLQTKWNILKQNKTWYPKIKGEKWILKKPGNAIWIDKTQERNWRKRPKYVPNEE